MKRLVLALLMLLPLMAMALPATPTTGTAGPKNIAAKKPAYKITFQVDGSTDSMLLLCFYYAQNERIQDTAFNNGKGRFVFEGDEVLKPGLYFFTNNKNRFAEFVIYHEKPFFQFHTDDRNWTMNMKVKGSKQNEIYYNYQRASESMYRELQEAKPSLDSAALADFSRRQHLRLDSLKLKIIDEHPEAMFSKMMLAVKNVDEEVPVRHPDGTEMTRQERYEWFMHHYFDYIPVDDDFIVRTPKQVFYNRVNDYVDKYMRGLPPEMICPLLDSLIDRSEPAPEVYRWLIFTMTNRYLQSTIMVYDEVYVHLVMRYFATGKASWLSPSTIDEQIERATKWERLLVGREAPELVLFDTNHHAHSLHYMRGDYTLLLFWSPSCGHCREIIPEVYKVFAEYTDSLNMSAFAILSEPDDATVVKWKKFLKDHHMDSPKWVNLNGSEANVDWREVYDITTTPQIYLIDNKTHKFLAKKLNAQILRNICENLTKQ